MTRVNHIFLIFIRSEFVISNLLNSTYRRGLSDYELMIYKARCKNGPKIASLLFNSANIHTYVHTTNEK